MQRWQDEFSKHPIHATLKILEDNAKASVAPLDSTGEAERTRLIKVLALIKKVVQDIDPDLAPIDILNALNNQLSGGAMNTFRALATQGSSALFQEANTHISTTLGYIYQLSALRSGKISRQSDLEAATTSFERFVKKTESYIGDIQSRAAKAIHTIDESATKIDQLKAESESIAASFKQELIEWGNKNNEFISNHKIGFTATLSKSQIEFNELIASVKSEASEAIKSLLENETAQAEANRTKINQKLDAIQKDAEAKHGEILKFYGLVTHDSVTGGPQENCGSGTRRCGVLAALHSRVHLRYRGLDRV